MSGCGRRAFVVALAAGLFSRSLAAQPVRVFRLGWLSFDPARAAGAYFDALREGLRERGYVEGRNIVFELRWADGSTERLEQLAAELARTKFDVIVTQGGPAIYPLMRAGISTPIVFGYSGDPVEGRLVESLARPGQNRTGVAYLALDLAPRRLKLLKETLPRLRKIGVISNPDHPGEPSERRAYELAAKAQGLELEYFAVRSAGELEDVLDFVPATGTEALIVFADIFTMRYSERLAAFAAKTRIPAMSAWSEFAERGNLMTYGPNLRTEYRRLAAYVDRILKGAKPVELPVQHSQSTELVVNRRAAKTLVLNIPETVLRGANRIIE